MSTVVHVAGWTLVHFLWQGTAIALAAAAVLNLLRAASSNTRYGVACLALVAMIATPVATAALLSDDDAPLGRRTVLLRRVAPPPDGDRRTFFVIGTRRQPLVAASSATVPAASMPAIMPAVVGAWFTGAMLLLIRLAGGWMRVRRLHHESRQLPPSEWQAVTDRLARWLGLRRRIRVVDAPLVETPVVVGWLRPVILLPVMALSSLTAEQVQAILAHELAHVRRHDAAVNFLQTVAETLLFYHPAVWWISARIRVEREHCCDDVAVETCGDAFGYASALATLAACHIQSPAFGMAATGGSLVERVKRVLGARPERPSPAGAALMVSLVLAFVASAGMAQYVVALQPPPRQAPSPAARTENRPAWRMIFDIPSGQMAVRGFTARDLVRYAYQLPVSRVIGGPEWLDNEAFELRTTLDHTPAADETPGIVRELLEARFHLTTHQSSTDVPVLALTVKRPDGALGPNLQAATGECVDQKAWIEAGRPQGVLRGQQVPFCGVWEGEMSSAQVRSISMDQFAADLRPHFGAMLPRDVVNRTRLQGVFDVNLAFFKMAAAIMAQTPSLRMPLEAAGFASLPTVLEDQLGLALVPATAQAPAIVIDHIERPLEELLRP